MPYAIACPERHAAAAGVDAFAAGGNALDAALAAATSLAVTYPHNCGVGGDLFAVVRFPDGRCVSVNASGPAARDASADALRLLGPVMPATGPDTITVPGAVRGWERLHRLGATLPWADAFAAAVGHAERGIATPSSLAAAIDEAADDIAGDPGMRGVFRPGGAYLRAGETLRQPALAETLRAVAARGADAFYVGGTGQRLVAGLRARGSRLTATDFSAFAAETTPPLTGRYGNLTLHTSPPNSSGVLLLQALAALDAAGDVGDPLGADAGFLAELLRLGAAQRDAELADPRSVAFDREAWLGATRLDALVRAARGGGAASIAGGGGGGARGTGDTVAIVSADASGLAVSLIQSLFGNLGARVLEPETGALMHNRGSFFSLTPDHPNELAGGRRPAHTLMPLVVERDGRLAGVLGTMGGKAHAQIHAQLLLGLMAGRTAAEAVAAPRWVVGGIEPGQADTATRAESTLDAEARAALVAAGMQVTDEEWPSERLGQAQAIWVTGDELQAGSDLRADGAAFSSPSPGVA